MEPAVSETVAPPAPPVPAGPTAVPPLWRNLQFQAIWVGQTLATVGVSVADVAYPLAILALTGSPGRAGLFGAIQVAGQLVSGLPAGQLADRYDRRTVVMAAEAVRVLVSGVVVVGLIAAWLSLPVLLAAAAVLGAGQAVTGAARLPLVRSVVAPEQLTRALVQDEVRNSGATLAGPPLGGALYAVRALAHALPFLFAAATFALSLLSALAMRFLPGGASPAAAVVAAGAPGDLADQDEQVSGADSAAEAGPAKDSALLGLRIVWGSQLLRAAMILIMIVNTIGVGLDLVIIVILRHQHVSSGFIGLVLAAAAVGALAGAPIVRPLHKIKPGVLLLVACLAEIPLVAGLALPYGPWWVAALLFAATLSSPALRVLIDVLLFRQTPDEQRGRVVAAVMTLIGLGMPAGLAGTGLLLQWLPARTTVLILASVLAAGVVYCTTKRDLWRARWPAEASAR
jgi:MFS family permease